MHTETLAGVESPERAGALMETCAGHLFTHFPNEEHGFFTKSSHSQLGHFMSGKARNKRKGQEE